MIPKTCILNDKHKLYVTLHGECTVYAEGGPWSSNPTVSKFCEGCEFWDKRFKPVADFKKLTASIGFRQRVSAKVRDLIKTQGLKGTAVDKIWWDEH